MLPTPLHVVFCVISPAHPLLLACNIPNFQLSNLYECTKEILLNRFILIIESRAGICNSPNHDVVI